ncbi:hypothetical protein MPTK1_3g05880 [Marchantia polymorpha subsp. ruderalis]|uniref:Uncharacterized protein n=2 Tax=Marchantia polymorpha TaxID=3197 RepID=A0AAF6AXU9_MARPO|nr:hypothetical protein MARPO_0006s0059 [Marchantia polymorpha]BBN04583.1 hypothetical protein Mp_3g05880 [Marchantia polymorpha subsp. ruderalis]|eukprot:PTQ48020.1 hypothetical protein MARPO_0006s0059 [Marchantia polymorpha]
MSCPLVQAKSPPVASSLKAPLLPYPIHIHATPLLPQRFPSLTASEIGRHRQLPLMAKVQACHAWTLRLRSSFSSLPASAHLSLPSRVPSPASPLFDCD